MPITVCIPCYHSTDLVGPTIVTVLSQTYSDIELIICNDSPDDHDKLSSLILSFADSRIRFHQNSANLGYPGNLRRCLDLASHDLVLLLGHDDLLLGENLVAEQVHFLSENLDTGAIARPYYWFDGDPQQPIRHTAKIGARKISVNCPQSELRELICSTGQLSGLVFRRSLITHGVHDHVFTSHVYPFLSILRTHNIYYWPEFTVAVRSSSSQTRYLSSIYHPSPTRTWMIMLQTVFPEPEYRNLRKIGFDLLGSNYLGLAQIKNFGRLRDLVADIFYLIMIRPRNILSLSFWIFSLGSLLVPPFILRALVDLYKRAFLRRVFRRKGIMTQVPRVAGS